MKILNNFRFVGLIFGLVYFAFSHASLAATIDSLPTAKFADELSRVSGYEVRIVGTLPSQKAATFKSDEAISKAVKSYLDRLGLMGYVIDINKNNKLIRIIIPGQGKLVSNVPSVPATGSNLAKSNGNDVIKKIKEEYRNKMKSMTDDTVL